MSYFTIEKLMGAYRKLKNYCLQNRTCLCLAQTCIDFEKSWEDYGSYHDFEKVRSKLDYILGDIDTSRPLDGKVNVVYQPKKNSIPLHLDSELLVTKVDPFFAGEIEIWLCDILFTLELLESGAYADNVDFRARIDPLANDIRSPSLFLPLWDSFREMESLLDATLNQEKNYPLSMISFDLERCYPSIRFDFSKLLEHVKLKGSPAAKIMHHVYCYYSSMLFPDKPVNHCVLPVGLPSTTILLGVLLRPMDEAFRSKTPLFYARFCDDTKIVMPAYTDEDDVARRSIKDLFNGLISQNSDGHEWVANVDSPILISKSLKINSQKLDIQNIGPKRQFIKRVSFASYFDAEEEKTNDSEALEEEPAEKWEKEEFTSEGNDNKSPVSTEKLMNNVSSWLHYLLKHKDDEEKYGRLVTAIQECLQRIRVQDPLLSRVSNDGLNRSLLSILATARMMTEAEKPEDIAFLGKTETLELLSYMDNVPAEKGFYFPRPISFFELSLFALTRDGVTLLNETKRSNKYASFIGLTETIRSTAQIIPPFETKDSLLFEFEKGLSPFTICRNESSFESRTNVSVGVVALNMEGVGPSDNWELKSGEVFGHGKKCITAQGTKGSSVELRKPSYAVNEIIELIKIASRQKANYIVFPEFSLHPNWVPRICKYCKRCNITIIGGLAHILIKNRYLANITLIYAPWMPSPIYKPKLHYAPLERELILSEGWEPWPGKSYGFIRVKDGACVFGVLTCYEATRIELRAALHERIEMLFMPVFNKDTDYFSSIIASFSRDSSIFIAQSNANEFGDSRITQPKGERQKDLVKVKGGENSYVVIGKIDLLGLSNDHQDYEKYDCSLKIGKSFYPYKKGNGFKKLSANDCLGKRKKNGIR